MVAQGTIFIANQAQRERAERVLSQYPIPFSLTIKKGAQRTTSQNAYLWGVAYKTILESAGESLAGWRAEDLHEYFLGECFGWERLKGFDRTRLRPLHRSSTMTKTEFSEYVLLVQQKAAELGIYIPDPDEPA